MATSQNPHSPRRRRLCDRSVTGAATPPGTGPTPDSTTEPATTEHHCGHPNARGTLPMANHPSTPPAPTTGEAPAPAGVSAADRAIMRARLAATAQPREGDSPRLAALRAILRDESLMAHVTANVEHWPPLSDEQRDTLGALLDRSAHRAARRSRRRAA